MGNFYSEGVHATKWQQGGFELLVTKQKRDLGITVVAQ